MRIGIAASLSHGGNVASAFERANDDSRRLGYPTSADRVLRPLKLGSDHDKTAAT